MRTQLRTQLQALLEDRLVPWDEGKHPRDEFGKWTFSGGGSAGSGREGSRPALRAGFVSPTVKSGLDFKGAVKELDSRQQGRLRLASQDINKQIGIDAHEVDIVGVWKDGAENSLMSRSDADWNETVLATVMKGHLADQKSVLVFQQAERGVGVLAQFEATGKLERIHKDLLKAGIENHTVVPNDCKGDQTGKHNDRCTKLAQRLGRGCQGDGEEERPMRTPPPKEEFDNEETEWLESLPLAKAREDFLTFRHFVRPKLLDAWWQRDVASAPDAVLARLKAGKRPALVIQAPPQHGKTEGLIDFMAWVRWTEPRTCGRSSRATRDDLGIRVNMSLQRMYDGPRYHKVFAEHAA